MKNKKLLAVFAALTMLASSAALTSCDMLEKIPVVGPIIGDLVGGSSSEEVTLKSIKLDPPTKTTYVWGEAFDPAGMVVTANYSDGSKKEIPAGEYTMSIAKGTKLTQNVDLVVTYEGMTAKKAIKVTNPAVSIEILTHATKLNYIPGQSFDPTGLVLAVKYTDGTQKEIVVAEDTSVSYSKDPLKVTDTQFAIKIGDAVVYETLSFGYGLFVEAETALINANNYSTPTDGIPSTSGGSYVGNMFANESISFLFTADKAGKADIAFVLASLYLKKDSNWTPMWMGDCQFNLICEVYVNGVKIDIPDSVILPGGGSEDNEVGSADLWTNWKEVVFEDIDIVQGANSIKLKFIPHNYTDTSQASFSGRFTANIDCLTVNTEDIVLTKLEADDLVINSVTTSSMELEVTEENAYIVVKGTADSTYPESELADAIAAYGYALASESATINGAEVTVSGNNFVLKLDITGAAEGAYALQLNGSAVEVAVTASEGEVAYRAFTLAEDGTLTVVSTAKINDYKPTSVKLEKVDGSVYFVIEGAVAWEGYESAEDVEAVLLPLLRFDLQGDLAVSGQNNRYLASADNHDITFTAGESGQGTYVMKICVDSLKGSKYSTHFGEDLKNLDFYNPLTQLAKEAVDVETKIQANHKYYQLAYEPEYSSSNPAEDAPGTSSDIRREHFYGCVGLTIVSDGSTLNIAIPEYLGAEVVLVEENGKPIVKIPGTTTITTDGYTMDEVKEEIAKSFVADAHGNLNSDKKWTRFYPTATVCELTALEEVENGYKFVVKMDLSEAIYTLGYTYMVKVDGAMKTGAENGTDLKLNVPLETEEQIAHATQTLAINDKLYTLKLADENSWKVLSFKSEANPDWVEPVEPSIEWATTTTASLEEVDGKVYVVIERGYTAANYTAEEIKAMAEEIAHNVERLSDWAKPSYDSHVVVGETSVKHYLDVTDFAVHANPYFFHYDKASGIYGNDGNYTGAIPEDAITEITLNQKVYKLATLANLTSNTWANGMTALTISEEAGYSLKAKGVSAEIKAEDDKALYVIHGTVSYEGFTAEQVQAKLEGLAVDFQGNPYAANGGTSWEGDWAYYTPVLVNVVMGEDGTYVATYDITHLKNFFYTGHYAGGDFKPAEAYDASVTVGGRIYRMFVVVGGGAVDCYGCVGLEIKDDPAAVPTITNYKPTSVKLEKVENSVYFVIEGSVVWEGVPSAVAAEKALRSLLQFDFQGDLATSSSSNRYLASADDHDITFTAGEGMTGTYVMKICVDSLTGSKYSTHFGEGLKNFDLFNPLTELAKEAVDVETQIYANHNYYQLVYEPEYSGSNPAEDAPAVGSDKSALRKEHYYGCVGLSIVSDGAVLMATPVRAEIKAEGDKALYVICGTATYEGYTFEEAQAKLGTVSLDLQENPTATGVSGSWKRHVPALVSVVLHEDGIYEATYDVTNLANYIYVGHYAGIDFKPADVYDVSVTVGGKVYRLFVVPGGSNASTCWGCVGLEVKDAPTDPTEPTEKSYAMKAQGNGATVVANPGVWYYFLKTSSGSTGTVESAQCTEDAGSTKIDISAYNVSATDTAGKETVFYVRCQPKYESGSKYTVSFTIFSTATGKVSIVGTDVLLDVEAGTPVEVAATKTIGENPLNIQLSFFGGTEEAPIKITLSNVTINQNT